MSKKYLPRGTASKEAKFRMSSATSDKIDFLCSTYNVSFSVLLSDLVSVRCKGVKRRLRGAS